MTDEPKRISGPDPRARLLAATLRYVHDHGIGEVSLRELAAAIGTSHRMLIYHFGSKEGLLVAVIQAMEAQQLASVADIDPDLDAADALREFWRRLADPALWPHERLFFEVYGQALQGRPGTVQLLDGIVESWLGPGTAYWTQRGATPAEARARARLGVAVVRGLLLDLLATQDRDGVDAAIESYIELAVSD